MFDKEVAEFFRPDDIAERHAINLGCERAKAEFVRLDLAGHGHGQQGAAVIGVFKDNNGRPLGIVTRDLYSIFDSLGSTVDKQGFLGKFAGCHLAQFFSQ